MFYVAPLPIKVRTTYTSLLQLLHSVTSFSQTAHPAVTSTIPGWLPSQSADPTFRYGFFPPPSLPRFPCLGAQLLPPALVYLYPGGTPGILVGFPGSRAHISAHPPIHIY